MVKEVFEFGKYEYVSFKDIRVQGPGQNSWTFWPINNPYFEVIELAKS